MLYVSANEKAVSLNLHRYATAFNDGPAFLRKMALSWSDNVLKA
jgi:hypothetical protein